MRKTISVSREVWLLMRSLQGLRHLADHAFDLPPEATAVREILSSLSAAMALVEARLLMLDRVISDAIDPAVVWSSVNDAGPAEVRHQDPDVHLSAWSAKHAVRRAREELRRAKTYLRFERRRRATSKRGSS